METLTANKKIELDIKRFYFPIALELKCPHCTEIITHDFQQNYLMYPTLNKPETIGLYCKVCDKESQVDVTLKLSLEIDKSTIKKN